MDNPAFIHEEKGRIFAISRHPDDNSNGIINPLQNYLVEVNTKSKIYRNPRFYRRLSTVLFILAFILFIALISIVVIYVKHKISVCTSSECLRSATNFKYSIDFSVDPCDNFYKFACGKWSNEHPNHGWYASFSTFQTIDEKLAITTLNFFESEAEEDEPDALGKSRKLYKSCMDTNAINNLGLSVIYKYLTENKLPLIPSIFNKTEDEKKDFKFDWMNSETSLKKIFSMDILIGFGVASNPFNISQNIMMIGTPGNKCQLPSPLNKYPNKLNKVKSAEKTDDDQNEDKDDNKDDDGDDEVDEEEIYKAFTRHIRGHLIRFVVKTIAANTSMDEIDLDVLEEAVDFINNMTDLIDDLSLKYSAEHDDYNISGLYLEELQKETDSYTINQNGKTFPNFYQKYIENIFQGTNITIDFTQDKIYTYEVEKIYLNKILSIILETYDVYIELYIWWVTVYAMIMNTTEDIVDYISKQTAPFYRNDQLARSRALECSALVNSYMGMAVSYILADKAFNTKTKPKVEKMINEIKAVFVERVNFINWMDKNTKKATLEKCQETISFIGYPEWLFKNGSLDEFYKKIEIKEDAYLENMINIIKQDYPDSLKLLRESHSRNWTTVPNVVNAYNAFFDNAINIPMAILNYPMYNLGLEVLNYGSIGSILGHEFIHGFDNSGRKHDKYGNFIQWWSNQTIETFESLSECFVSQYDNFTIEGVSKHVNGKKTLGENIADNGGLNQAYEAYRAYIHNNGEEHKLPGFENYTSFQMFFIAYGSIWCETTNLEDVKNNMKYDEHAPNSVRVLGTLQNSRQFSEAFQCPRGSNMNPMRKCKIW